MSQTEKVVLRHLFHAKPEVIFKAWTTASMLSQWFDATCGGDRSRIHVKDAKIDLRVGGKFELKMGGTALHSGEYREVNPYSKLVFTWNSPVVTGTLVTIDLRAMDGKTHLTLTHERIPMDLVEAHTQGWGHIFSNLDGVLEKSLVEVGE